jgi:hypothetical protein
MKIYLPPSKTAIAIDAALGVACASGDLDVADRLFESYRLLLNDYEEHRGRPSVLSLPVGEAPPNGTPKTSRRWWGGGKALLNSA